MSREKRRAFLLGVLVGQLLMAIVAGLTGFLISRIHADELEQAKAEAGRLRFLNTKLATELKSAQNDRQPFLVNRLQTKSLQLIDLDGPFPGPVDNIQPIKDEMRRELRDPLRRPKKDN
jgi:hypothetical protein